MSVRYSQDFQYTSIMTLSLSKLHVNNLSDGSAINNTLQQIAGAFGTVISAQY
ncbi:MULTISPECIES: hypothetical protein [Leuconostoc]|uniref:hypothetical protein n=1 Tax=Leuconostoc TaxID=1243 RepID=UPI0022E8B00A|nr:MULTISPECIES: hypothetical protein [Leuconostoc]MDI6550936.1 hypothetical protein [Leuconostoc suionicum]